MSEKSEASVIASLPHARPQRRSDKRAVKPVAAPAPEPQLEAAGASDQDEPPSQERSDPAAHAQDQDQEDQHNRCPASLAEGAELVGTVVRATAELAEIGLTLGARTLRGALARLPRP